MFRTQKLLIPKNWLQNLFIPEGRAKGARRAPILRVSYNAPTINLVNFKMWKSKIFQFYELTNFLGPCYFCLFDPTFLLVHIIKMPLKWSCVDLRRVSSLKIIFLLKNHQGKCILVKWRWTLFLKLLYSELSAFLLQ